MIGSLTENLKVKKFGALYLRSYAISSFEYVKSLGFFSYF